MKVEVLPDAEAVACRAAALMAQEARSAAEARGRFVLAVSGGTTPWRMLELLATEDVPWPLVHLFQVDERVAKISDPARNLAQLKTALLDRVPLPKKQVHAMPVEETNLTGAAARYAATLRDVAGAPATLDLIQLGLGVDGHTASLLPGDPGMDVASDVAVTGPYEGYRRMTLTYPVLGSSRHILWVVTGSDKAAALLRLLRGDPSIPAGRVPQERAVLFADTAAARPPR